MSDIGHLAWDIYHYDPYQAGVYGTALAVSAWFKARPHLPHHHDGYVSINGTVHKCTLCDKAPKNLDQELAEVRAYIAEHPWAGPYMGPDAEWRNSEAIKGRQES